ncbi:MAG TPA: ABC transporter permease [Gemmatimonadaceae bacterium]|jgi:putative ABC transport system permease protein|nr:ABC transporter permease [Gemmatimonadaceae bacterium]
MNDLVRSVRIALRGLGRTPGFLTAAIVILGLGIGTAVAVFTVFRAVLFQRLPVTSADRLVVLSTYRDKPDNEFGLVKSDLKAVAREARTMRKVGGYAHWATSEGPLVDGDRTLTLGRVVVNGTFFDALGAHAAIGRLLRPEDDVPGAAPVLVLSYANWQHWFGGDSSVVGHHLYEPYSQLTYTVVGVAPPGLDFPNRAGYWILWPGTEGLSVIAVARLNPGATPRAAADEFAAIVKRTPAPGTPVRPSITGAKVVPFTQAMLGDIRPVLIALSAAVALLLAIACVNVGGLLLLRASGRARELAIRRALGATYADVARQLLLESGLIALGGGVVGFLSAGLLVQLLVAAAPARLPRLDVVQLSGTPLWIGIGVTILAVLLFGVVPSLVAAKADVASALRLDARSGRDSASRRRFRHTLVAAQTTLALVMLSGAALLARSLARLESIDLGYKPDHLTQLSVSWPSKKYDSVSKYYPLGEEILRRWRSIPGVISVTPTLIPPLVGDNVFLSRFDKEGQSASEIASNPFVPEMSGDKDYFRTFGTRLVSGRAFTDADRENAAPVAIVSEMVAKRMWPGENPIGKRVHYLLPDSIPWRTVIGVAEDSHIRTLRSATPIVYVPWRQMDFWQFGFAIRTRGELGAVLPALRRELVPIDPLFRLWYVHPTDELLAGPLTQPRISTYLMSVFGVAALLLAAIGLYGLMASLVREQTREIGIRMALGAEPERLRREVLLHALQVTGAGAIVGIVAALAASKLLSAMLFELSPTDPVALAGACGVLFVVIIVAAYAPARRATRVDPSIALRAD